MACAYYRLPGYRSAVVIPEVVNLSQWIKQRQQLSASTAQNLSTKEQQLVKRSYRNYQSSGAAESALYFLLQERVIAGAEALRVRRCEVYQLGKQAWDGNQSYLKQAVHHVNANDRILEIYESAYYLFPPKMRKNDKGKAGSRLLLCCHG